VGKATLAPWRLYSGRGLPPSVRALATTSFLQDVASEMVYPLLPAFVLRLGGGAAAVGGMEAAAETVLALVKGWAGRASDRSGRRKGFVVAGYALSAATRPLLAAAATALHVVLLRVVDRLGKGLRTAPRDALIADATSPEQRGFAFSYHRGLDHLGAAVGPLLAAGVLALAPGGVRLVFALATLPAALGVLNVLLRVRERPRAAVAPVAAAPGAARPPTTGAAIPPALRLPLVAFLLFALGNASDAFVLLRAAAAGVSPLGLTLLWSAFHVAKWACSAPAGRLADRCGPARVLLAGWALYAAVYLGFAAADGPRALGALLLIYALHFGLTEGAERALVVSLGGEAGTGTVLGAFHLVSGLGAAVASLLFAAVWELVSPAAAFVAGAALAVAAASVLAAALVRPSTG
jgi:MFS family permease